MDQFPIPHAACRLATAPVLVLRAALHTAIRTTAITFAIRCITTVALALDMGILMEGVTVIDLFTFTRRLQGLNEGRRITLDGGAYGYGNEGGYGDGNGFSDGSGYGHGSGYNSDGNSSGDSDGDGGNYDNGYGDGYGYGNNSGNGRSR